MVSSNCTEYPINAVNGTELYVTASDTHAAPPGNLSAWNEFAASAQLWPVLVVWGWNHRASMTNNVVEEGSGEGAASAAWMMSAANTIKPLAQLSCIKAVGNRRPAPTAMPTTVPESKARVAMELRTTSTFTGLALLTVALSFVLFC